MGGRGYSLTTIWRWVEIQHVQRLWANLQDLGPEETWFFEASSAVVYSLGDVLDCLIMWAIARRGWLDSLVRFHDMASRYFG